MRNIISIVFLFSVVAQEPGGAGRAPAVEVRRAGAPSDRARRVPGGKDARVGAARPVPVERGGGNNNNGPTEKMGREEASKLDNANAKSDDTKNVNWVLFCSVNKCLSVHTNKQK